MGRVLSAVIVGIVALLGALGSEGVFGQPGGGPSFEVTVTNLTRGQTFTPVLVASHRVGVTLFTLGEPASPELATLAEEGNTGPLAALLAANPDVLDVGDSGPPPGLL